MYRLDLNCDMGESLGPWQMGQDAELLPLVTSVNIACGFHAGDPGVMRRTVEQALAHGVAIGAHPGLPDLVGFGRRHMAISPQEVYDLVLYQTGALAAFVKVAGGRLRHVKPHGALYNMAARDAALAEAIARAVRDLDDSLLLYGLAGSELVRQAEALGLPTAHEVFADRSYQADGSLTPREQPGALLEHDEAAVAQVLQMVTRGSVRSLQGEEVALRADTLCLHGDGTHALSFARSIRAALQAAGVDVRAL